MYDTLAAQTSTGNWAPRGIALGPSYAQNQAAATETLENALQALAALACEVRDMSAAVEDKIGGAHPRPASDQKDRGMNVLSRVKSVFDVLQSAHTCMNSTLNSLG